MRDFSWKYFVMTGDVDAYLLYKEASGQADDEVAAGAVAEEMVDHEESE